MPDSITLALTPADVLMFRDSKPFGTGGDARSTFPTPQTITGAVRSWLRATGIPEDLKSFFIDGPYLEKDGTVWLPVPRHVMCDESDNLVEALPYGGSGLPRVTTARDLPESVPPLWVANIDKDYAFQPGWVKAGVVKGIIAGSYRGEQAGPLSAKRDIKADEHFLLPEPRTRSALEASTGRAADSMLFTTVFTRLKRDVRLRIRIAGKSEESMEYVERGLQNNPCLLLGGETRVAVMTKIEGDIPQGAQLDPIPEYIVTYLATPGLFAGPFPKQMVTHGWLLCGAATGEPLPVSGWDSARTLPIKTRYAARAGSVYFWKKKDETATIPPYVCADPRDNRSGWGRILTGGIWNYVS